MTTSPPREHFGKGRLSLQRELSVFINCPFDPDYLPLFDSIVFASICCGFRPRSALESGTVAAPRIGRILDALTSSKYSIHDLSRCSGQGDLNLARFNMPLELGVAIGRGLDSATTDGHDWLVLVPQGHLYKQFASDLAGFDPAEHSGTTDTLLPPVIAWLATRPEAVYVPTPQDVLTALPAFAALVAELRAKWKNALPWADLCCAALDTADSTGVLPGRISHTPGAS